MSPTVFKEGGYRFFFFSREEPRMHVHIAGQNGEAKFWLEPHIQLAANHGFSQIQLRESERIVEAHYDELKRAWETHFGG